VLKYLYGAAQIYEEEEAEEEEERHRITDLQRKEKEAAQTYRRHAEQHALTTLTILDPLTDIGQ